MDGVDIIVVAELGQVKSQLAFFGYNSQGTMVSPATVAPAAQGATSVPPRSLPLTDYYVDSITDVILDDGTIQAEEDVILRMPGLTPAAGTPRSLDSASWYPMGETGDYRMFFLHALPDGAAYSLRHGPCSRVRMDETFVTCSDGDKTTLPFMEGVTPAEFVTMVEDEL
jgi:hypothetical protein